jgi:hypothetical protein
MKRRWPGRVGQWLSVVASALFALSGLRLMTVAVAWAAEARAPAPPLAAPDPATWAPVQRSRVATHTASNAVARPPALPSGEPLRLMLAISAGAPRSEVFVNGSRLGLSPFLGDFTCKRGEKLKVEIVPVANRPLIEREATCDGKTLRIED